MTETAECAYCGLVLQSCCKQHQPIVYCPTTRESGPGTPICCLCLVRDLAREHVQTGPPFCEWLRSEFQRWRMRRKGR